MYRDRPNLIQFLIFLSLATLGILLITTTPKARAQSSGDDWSQPINLSQSGGATNPILVVDSEGTLHTFWEDIYAGFVHAYSSDGVQWSQPAVLNTPFELDTIIGHPHLVADDNGHIHFFWKESNSLFDDILFYSRVDTIGLINGGNWEPIQHLATSVIDMDIVVDAEGVLHLAYITTTENELSPAGVHYIHTLSNQLYWTSPITLYQSPYFRTLSEDDSANVDIATSSNGETTQVFVTWDNRSRERVFFTKSDDGGQTWGDPIEVDQPDEGRAAEIPFNIQVAASYPSVLLLWQAGQPDANCVQYYQKSGDGGETWDEPESILTETSGCPHNNEIFISENGLVILLTSIQNQKYLLAWDGNQWSEAQPQRSLSSFVDPETYNQVDFGCHQVVLAEDQLFIAGCDLADGGDIWLTSRMLGSVEDWFPPPPVWSHPTIVVSGESEMSSPVTISDPDGRIHVFWSQPDESSGNAAPNEIYYLRMMDERWSHPALILKYQEGKADQISAAVRADGRMMVVWSGGNSGEIHFSRADSAQAMSTLDWTNPQILPSPRPVGSSPDIVVNDTGVIHVAYAIPLNEERGVYITNSSDGGDTWSDPVIVFDAVAAEWDMVDDVHLTQTPDGHLHILWTRHTVPGGSGPQALYYAHSDDGGKKWSEADMVVGKPIIWSEIIGIGKDTVHRFWQENSNGRRTLWHQISQDQGNTWGIPINISIFNVELLSISISSDSSSQLHLLQSTKEFSGKTFLQHWTWNNKKWIRNEALDLGIDLIAIPDSMDTTISTEGLLAVLYAGLTTGEENDEILNNLFFTNRSLDLPEVTQPTLSALPSPTPTPAPMLETISIPTSMPTPTIDLSSLDEQREQSGLIPLDSQWSGLAIGGGLAVLVAAITLGVRAVQSRRR